MPIFIGVFWVGSDVGRWVGWLVGIKVDDGGLCGNCNLGGIWDLGLQQQQHVFAGKPVGKADRGSTNSRDTQPDTSTLGTPRSSKHTQGHQHTR